MKFTLKYEIPNQGWWTPDYVDKCNPVEDMINNLVEYKRLIRNAYAESENKHYFKGYTDFHKLRYLRETLIGENNIDASTSLAVLEKCLLTPDASRNSLKINNLKESLDHLFPESFKYADCVSQLPIEQFTSKFIQNVHKKVGAGLIETPGIYRNKWCAPSKESWTYLAPQLIANCLDSLCQFVREELTKEQSNQLTNRELLIGRVKIVATFLINFLHIHPFTNGNGRVARLMLSWLMSDVSIVPVPLFSSLQSPETYLNCIRDSRHSSPFVPESLARLILESVVHSHRLVCVSLDLH